ncbi:MAG: RNA methyltransferase [Cytophagales bacterium]
METPRKLKVEELDRISAASFKAVEKNPVVVVLDNVRSLSNVGSVFRTSDSFAVESIFLCGITGTPPDREINKTALGATESVNWKYFKSVTDAIHELNKDGFLIYAVEQAVPKIMLNEFVVNQENQKSAFIFGNEVYGVSDEALSLVDLCIEIPQFGTKHSMNVSVTAGIVLWHYVLQTTLKK